MTLNTFHPIEATETGVPVEVFDILVRYPELTDHLI